MEETIKNGQQRDTSNRENGRDNRETQAIEKMEETIKNGQQRDTSNRENRRDNQEWTIERHKKHWTQYTK